VLLGSNLVNQLIEQETMRPIILTGKSLSIPEVMAAAGYGSYALLRPSIVGLEHPNDSVRFLEEELDRGHSIYGIF